MGDDDFREFGDEGYRGYEDRDILSVYPKGWEAQFEEMWVDTASRDPGIRREAIYLCVIEAFHEASRIVDRLGCGDLVQFSTDDEKNAAIENGMRELANCKLEIDELEEYSIYLDALKKNTTLKLDNDTKMRECFAKIVNYDGDYAIMTREERIKLLAVIGRRYDRLGIKLRLFVVKAFKYTIRGINQRDAYLMAVFRKAHPDEVVEVE